MGLFRAPHEKAGAKRPPLKIFHTYSTMMKLGTVIPCLNNTQNKRESRDTPLEFC